MSSSNKISIILVYYNNLQLLTNFLNEIYINNYNLEYILVVNSKKSFSEKLIKKKFPNIKIIFTKKNIGFGSGVNLGVKYANGSSIIFLNYDAFIKKKDFKITINKIRLRLQRYDFFSFLSKKNKHQFSISGYHTINFLGNLGISKKNAFYSEGSFLIIKKKLFNNLRGFDDKFFMYVEDVDLSWRAHLFNKEIKVFKDTNYIHLSGKSSSGSILTKEKKYVINFDRRFHVEKNNLRMLLKNYSVLTLLIILPLYFFQFIIDNLIAIFTLNFRYNKILYKSLFWNIINLSSTLEERNQTQKLRKKNDFYIFSKMSFKFNKISTYIRIFMHNL